MTPREPLARVDAPGQALSPQILRDPTMFARPLDCALDTWTDLHWYEKQVLGGGLILPDELDVAAAAAAILPLSYFTFAAEGYADGLLNIGPAWPADSSCGRS